MFEAMLGVKRFSPCFSETLSVVLTATQLAIDNIQITTRFCHTSQPMGFQYKVLLLTNCPNLFSIPHPVSNKYLFHFLSLRSVLNN